MTLLLLLSTIIHNAYSIPTITKTAILTPFNQRNNGARVMFSVEESPVVDLWWDVHIKYSHTWQLILAADESFGIDTNWDSSITFTMNIPEIQTKELLFAFTTDNMQYISVSIPMNRIGRSNKIYPACSLISKLPVFGYGDISQIPATDRSCDIAGGDCLYWKDMLPSNLGFNNYAPITFTLKNNRRTNEIILYYRSDSFVQGFTQSCRFAQHFVSQPGIKIYISGDNIGELYSVSSFNITSQIQKPTAAPTYNPTQTPTISTESPTHIPSQTPTFNPTRSTKNPSPAPSNYPTKDQLISLLQHQPKHQQIFQLNLLQIILQVLQPNILALICQYPPNYLHKHQQKNLQRILPTSLQIILRISLLNYIPIIQQVTCFILTTFA